MGIEFLLELQSKLEGATEMTRALTGVEKAVERTDRKIKTLEHDGSILGNWFRDFGKSAAESFTGLLAAEAVWDSFKEGASIVKELVSTMFEAAAAGERTKLAFGNMLGEEEGERLLGNLDRFSKSTEFTREANKGFAQSLLDAGFAGEQLNLAMSAVSDVAARSPNKMAGAEGAINALSRAMLTGTLDARSLRMLKLSPKVIFKQMADDLGIGVKEVQQRLEHGKIKTDDVLNSIFKGLAEKGGGTLGKVGADMANSFGARWEKLKDTLPAIFERLENAPGFKAFSDAIQGIVDELSPEGRAGQSILDGLSAAFNGAGEVVKNIDWVSGINTLIEVGGTALHIVEAIGGAFGSVVKAVTSAGDQINDFLESVLTLGHLTDRLGLTNMGTRISREAADQNTEFHASEVGKRMDAHSAELRARHRAMTQFAPGDLSPMGNAFNQGIFSGVALGPASEAGKAIGNATGQGIVAGAKEGLGTHSPSAEFAWMGEMSARGFQQGLEMAPPSLAAGGVMAGMGPPDGGGRGNVTITAPINVSVSGSDASAQDIAEAIRVEVPTALLAALEQLGLAGGTT